MTSEFTTFQEITRSQDRYIPGVTRFGPSGVEVIQPSRIATDTWTKTIAVRNDSNLPFRVLQNDVEVFRGVTPVRVTNFDPGVRYVIVCRTRAGIENRAWFEISTSRPFTRNIHIE